jgi:pimeloyl-ACP methyl ester carboxylesterase
MRELAIVLLPGLDGTGLLFGPFVEQLPPDVQPIVVAYPGDELLGYEALLEFVVRALPKAMPFIILGESFSGPLALMAAATHPAGLQAVVLCASFVSNPLWLRGAWLRHLVRPFAFRLYPQFAKARALLGRFSTPELQASVQKAIAAVSPAVLAHRVRAVLTVDVTGQLASCPVPILYLQGTRDRVVPKRNIRRITAIRPTVEVEAIDAPHMVLQTQPAAAVRAITKFLASRVPSSSARLS